MDKKDSLVLELNTNQVLGVYLNLAILQDLSLIMSSILHFNSFMKVMLYTFY